MKDVFECDTQVRNFTKFLPVLLEPTSDLIAPTALVLHLVRKKYDANNSNKYRMYRSSVLQV